MDAFCKTFGDESRSVCRSIRWKTAKVEVDPRSERRDGLRCPQWRVLYAERFVLTDLFRTEYPFRRSVHCNVRALEFWLVKLVRSHVPYIWSFICTCNEKTWRKAFKLLRGNNNKEGGSFINSIQAILTNHEYNNKGYRFNRVGSTNLSIEFS